MRIEEVLCTLPEFLDAELVLTYLGFGTEVPTTGIVKRAWEMGKNVALPKCGEKPCAMSWHLVDSLNGLDQSRFGMEEPPYSHKTLVDTRMANADKTIAVVPGLCFDRLGYRLGYGGGYYDAFLQDFAGASVGLCRETELVECLGDLIAIEEYDMRVGVVVTETQVIRIPR